MQERTGAESEDAPDGGADWPTPLLNMVNVRIPSTKNPGGQVMQLMLRNDTTAGQLLLTVSEVCILVHTRQKVYQKLCVLKTAEVQAE